MTKTLTRNVFPRLGDETAPILIVLDPTVGESPRSKPLASEDVEWFAPRIAEFTKLPRNKIQFMSACPTVDFDTWGSDKKMREALKEHEAAFLEEVRRLKPKMIVPMGAKAAQQVLGRSVQITKARGIVQENTKHFPSDVVVFPCTSPFFARRHPEADNIFCADLETLGRIAKSGFDAAAVNARAEMTTEWCYDIKHLLDNPPSLVCADVEGIGLTPFAPTTRLLTVQLTVDAGKSVVIPVDYDGADLRHHKFHDWLAVCKKLRLSNPRKKGVTFRQRPRNQEEAHKAYRIHIVKQLRQLLENKQVKVIGQNFKFDWLYLYYTTGIEVANYYGDTLNLAHSLDENLLTKNLDDLVRIYVPDMAGFNDAHNADPEHHGKSRMDLFTPAKMLAYAGNDTIATWALYNKLLAEIKKDPALFQCYKKTVMRALRAFCYVEINGFTVNIKALQRFEAYLTKVQASEKIWLLDQLPESIKEKWRNNGVGLKPERAAILIDYMYQHPDGLKLPVIVTTKTGLPSVSKKEAMPYYAADSEFIRRMILYIENQKMLTTYVQGFYKYIVDGKIRPSFSFHTAVTGRSSCVHADTLIPTHRGMVRIEDMQYGDLVKTHKNRWRRVVRQYIKPVQSMYDVTFSNGETLRCTEEHRFLLPCGKWESLRNVCVKAALGRYPTAPERGQSLHQLLADYDAGFGGVRTDSSHHDANSTRGLGGRPVSHVQDGEVFGIQDGEQEPDAWAEAGQPQAGGVARGWTWLPDDCGGRSALLRAPCCDCSGARDASFSASGEPCGASHRRKPTEQRAGQSCAAHECGAPGDTHPTSRNLQDVVITKVHHCGSYRVYDIEVEEDHSYAACGVLNHNSSNPNGQNFPKRSKLAKVFRKVFEAPKGWVYGSNDLSQAELRIAAMMSQDATMLEVYRTGGDIHKATAAGVMGLTMEQFYALDEKVQKTKRNQAKAVNFGFLYGMWWRKFRSYAKTDYGIDFTDEEAENIRTMFFKTYPALANWHKQVEKFARKNGFVRSYNGRVRHLPMVWSPDESVSKQAIRQSINSPVQSIASDLGLMAIGLLVPYLRRTGLDRHIKVCGFIHDAIVYLVRDGYAARAARCIKKFMENLPLQEWFGWTPDVPIIADVELGRNLTDTYEFDEKYYALKSGNKSFTEMERAIRSDMLPRQESALASAKTDSDQAKALADVNETLGILGRPLVVAPSASPRMLRNVKKNVIAPAGRTLQNKRNPTRGPRRAPPKIAKTYSRRAG